MIIVIIQLLCYYYPFTIWNHQHLIRNIAAINVQTFYYPLKTCKVHATISATSVRACEETCKVQRYIAALLHSTVLMLVLWRWLQWLVVASFCDMCPVASRYLCTLQHIHLELCTLHLYFHCCCCEHPFANVHCHITH